MNDILIIGIAGGSGSGKSAFTRRLKARFGEDMAVLHHDDYYRDQTGTDPEQRKKINYDHPDSLETDLLLSHLRMLREGRAISCPVYDFTKHNRSAETMRIEPAPVIIVEGILVLSDPALREMMDLKIFVDSDADERIIRRILRDVKKRKRDLEGIVSQYRSTVKPMHSLFVEPAKQEADIVLNGGLNDRAFALAEAFIEKHLSRRKKLCERGEDL